MKIAACSGRLAPGGLTLYSYDVSEFSNKLFSSMKEVRVRVSVITKAGVSNKLYVSGANQRSFSTSFFAKSKSFLIAILLRD